jgi:hypothetical protein
MQPNIIIQCPTHSVQYNTCIDKYNKTHYSFYRIYMNRGLPCSKEMLESATLYEVVLQAPLQQPSCSCEKTHATTGLHAMTCALYELNDSIQELN